MLDSLTALGYTSLRDLITLIKDMAPEVWSIYVRQVYIESIGIYVLTILSLIGILSTRKNFDFDDLGTRGVVFIVCSVSLFLTVILGILLNGYVSIFNPEYQVIQKLLGR